jgi:hypothetical protein
MCSASKATSWRRLRVPAHGHQRPRRPHRFFGRIAFACHAGFLHELPAGHGRRAGLAAAHAQRRDGLRRQRRHRRRRGAAFPGHAHPGPAQPELSAQRRAQVGLVAAHHQLGQPQRPELAMPYYWNIAPNRDATLAPRIITRRAWGWTASSATWSPIWTARCSSTGCLTTAWPVVRATPWGGCTKAAWAQASNTAPTWRGFPTPSGGRTSPAAAASRRACCHCTLRWSGPSSSAVGKAWSTRGPRAGRFCRPAIPSSPRPTSAARSWV